MGRLVELRHLRYFVAVAEERHFGRAAERLHVTQSTLSSQIQALERDVGGALFVRTSRRVELTEAGVLLLEEARHTLAQADRALRVTRESISGASGHVQIGFAGVAVLQEVLAADLRRFREHHPDVEIGLVELPPAAQVEAVRRGEIDVGYTPDLGLDDVTGLTVTHRRRTALSIAVRPDHRLASSAEVTPAELLHEDLITYATEGQDATVLPRLWPAGTHRGHIHLVGSTLGVLAMAAAGLGVAIVPAATSRIALSSIVYRPMPETIPGPDTVTISRGGDTSGAVHAFLDQRR